LFQPEEVKKADLRIFWFSEAPAGKTASPAGGAGRTPKNAEKAGSFVGVREF
jgi:hypothetical protein